MATKRIDALPSATAAAGHEIPAMLAGVTNKITVSSIGASYVPLAGGNMTGALIMTPNSGVNGAAGTARSLTSFTAGSPRWELTLGNTTAESSTADGSDFTLTRYNNSGAYIDTPMAISRANGVVSYTKSLTVGTGYDGDAFVNINAKAASYGGLIAMVGWATRWAIVTQGAPAETGSGNVGSDFNIERYNDAGTKLDTPLAITRDTGHVKFGTFTSNADTPVTGYITIKDAGGTLRKLAVIA